MGSGRMLTLPPAGVLSGRRCPHRLWNGDEDVAAPFQMGAEEDNGVASKYFTFASERPNQPQLYNL
jgi:hypothetical protein